MTTSTWTAIASFTVSQDWEFTPAIPAELGYVRFQFSAVNVPLWIAQVDNSDPDSPLFWDERRFLTPSYRRVYGFSSPAFFQQRAIAIRSPVPGVSLTVEIQVSSVPFDENGIDAPIPWDSPGAIGSTLPNEGKFREIEVEKLSSGDAITISAGFTTGDPAFSYRFGLLGSYPAPDLIFGTFLQDGGSFQRVLQTKSYGETQMIAPFRFNYPIVLPVAPWYIPQDYVYYFSPSIFFQTDSSNNPSLMAGYNGKLYRVPMELVEDWT